MKIRKQIKIFQAGNNGELETKVNGFLKTLHPQDVIGTQYVTDSGYVQCMVEYLITN